VQKQADPTNNEKTGKRNGNPDAAILQTLEWIAHKRVTRIYYFRSSSDVPSSGNWL
jgi:hypothetical protein